MEVVDASSNDCEFNMNVTADVLKEIGAGDIPHITAFNKMDLIENPDSLPFVQGKTIYISAKKQEGIDQLIDEISSIIYADMRKASMVIPYDQGQISSYLCEKCRIHRMEYQNEGTYFEADLTAADYNRLEKYFV